MSNIPQEGYRLDQCSFKESEKDLIYSSFEKFKEKLKNFGLVNFWEKGTLEEIEKVSLRNLYEISNNWEKDLFSLEQISYKVLVIKEFRQLFSLIQKSKEVSIKITDQIQILEDDLRKSYSAVITNNTLFSDYFSYKEFKIALSMLTSADVVSLDSVQKLRKENIFIKLRKKIISDRSNLSILMKDSNPHVHINQLFNEDFRTYQLIRTEFYLTLCEEAFKIKIPFGKTAHTEIIRPSHPLAETFKLDRSEIVYLTVSLDPIADAEVEIGDEITFNNGMKFNVVKNQEVVRREMFYPISLDNYSKCNLTVPFYYSFIRCQLVKEQRSNINKLLDPSMVEEVSPHKK